MPMFRKLNYWRRIFKVYLMGAPSYLDFWHENPEKNPEIADFSGELVGYYMTFFDKANYRGPKDKRGVIMFDYHGSIGRAYNPLAIAQYGLAHFNIYLKEHKKENLEIARTQADWLTENLEKNEKGIWVWRHKFDWDYKETLKSGWYSALAQGTGMSLLVRLYHIDRENRYLEAAQKAFTSMDTEIKDGGVKFIDKKGNVWLEEYIVAEPTHILNGFIWALWGVRDYYFLTKDSNALDLWKEGVRTLSANLRHYDMGFWSKYDLSRQFLRAIASRFYHRLHLVQLDIMEKLSGEEMFKKTKEKWANYENNFISRNLALIYKIIFKLFYW